MTATNPATLVDRLHPLRLLRAFRLWRRTRPFWGGLLIILSAVPLVYFPLAPLAVFFRLGLGAMAGVTIAVLMVVCGLSVWFAPHLRVVLGLITVVLALAAFPLSNLGGFLVGTLLGLVGGAMTASWGQSRKQRRQSETEADQL